MNDSRNPGWYFTYWQAGKKAETSSDKGPFENLYAASKARRAMFREPVNLLCDTPFCVLPKLLK
jgi:hypothetical protein